MIRLALLIACLATPAAAQGGCGPREVVIGLLTGPRYEEVKQDQRIQGEYIHELYANPATGTWTITTTLGQVTCIVRYGGGIGQPQQDAPA
ncbi:MAG: hypothetical protein ACPG4X_20835 [Pikeienuella sp.]